MTSSMSIPSGAGLAEADLVFCRGLSDICLRQSVSLLGQKENSETSIIRSSGIGVGVAVNRLRLFWVVDVRLSRVIEV